MALYDITALDSALEFDTTAAFNLSTAKIPSNDWVAIAWSQSTTVFNVQIFSFNTTTGAISAIGSPVDLETGTAGNTAAAFVLAIDSTHIICFWVGPASDGFCRMLSIDGSGNLTAMGSAVEFDTSNLLYPTAVLMDSTHILVCWRGAGTNVSQAQVFTINTGTGAITPTGTPLNWASDSANHICLTKLSSTKALVTYAIGTDDDGFAIVLDVNTSTWAVTAAGSAFEFGPTLTLTNGISNCLISSGSPMVAAIYYIDSATNAIKIGTFNINTSTWAITSFGSLLSLNSQTSGQVQRLLMNVILVDANTLLVFSRGTDDDGYAYTLDYDSGSGDLSIINTLEFYTDDNYNNNAVDMGNAKYINAWTDGATADGFVRAFSVTLTEIKTVDGLAEASVKTFDGLANASIKTINGLA